MSTLIVQHDTQMLEVSNDSPVMSLHQTTVVLEVNTGTVELPDGAPYYEHLQPVPAAVWNVIHNLGRMPSVTVTTSAGDVVVGHVQHIDSTTLTITFSAAFAGRAYLV
jgi:hypothetical protein